MIHLPIKLAIALFKVWRDPGGSGLWGTPRYVFSGPNFQISGHVDGALLEVPGLPDERRLFDCAEGCALPGPYLLETLPDQPAVHRLTCGATVELPNAWESFAKISAATGLAQSVTCFTGDPIVAWWRYGSGGLERRKSGYGAADALAKKLLAPSLKLGAAIPRSSRTPEVPSTRYRSSHP